VLGVSLVRKEIMALRYEGCTQFRQRIVAATLSQKSLRIDKIRDQDDSPGLNDFEANFLRLIEKITDGTCFRHLLFTCFFSDP
jgi:RNA 3'-terminal phosphate cyclase